MATKTMTLRLDDETNDRLSNLPGYVNDGSGYRQDYPSRHNRRSRWRHEKTSSKNEVKNKQQWPKTKFS